MSDDILDRYSRGNTPSPNAEGSFTPTDIFNKYDRTDTVPIAAAPTTPSWQDAEALEQLAAQGVNMTPPVPKKPGRGIVQALLDYPGHILNGLINTVEAPGNVLASKVPSTSESLIPDAVNLAGITKLGEIGGTRAIEPLKPSNQAVNKLVATIEPKNIPDVVNRLKSDPTMTLADVSPTVRQLAQGLAADAGQPKAMNAITQAVEARKASRASDVESAYTKAMGPSPDVPAMVENLKANARKIGQEEIQPVLDNARLVDTSPVIKAIDDKLQPGVNPLLSKGSELPLSAEQEALARIKSQLLTAGGEQLFDANRLHRIQSDVGNQIYQLSKSPDPKDRLLSSQLRPMNEKLIDQIDEATGGAYRPARQKYADANRIQDAFESGFDTLKNRSGIEGALSDSPEAFRNWMKTATPEEVAARRLGTRADIDQKINSVRNSALRGETVTQIPFNQEKLKMLFGESEANRLITAMQNSSDKALTNAALTGGSHTARIEGGKAALAIPPVGGGNPLQWFAPVAGEMLGSSYGVPGVGAVLTAAKGLHVGAQMLNKQNALARNAEFARASMATGFDRSQLINKLMGHPKVVRELKKSSNALTSP